MRRLGTCWLSVLACVLAAAGCSPERTMPTASQPRTIHAPIEPPAGPVSPLHALSLLQYAWVHRDTFQLGLLPSQDFEFVFAASGSPGVGIQGASWGRRDELASSRHLFVGGGTPPPADGIALDFDWNQASVPLEDPRPGHQNAWHRMIRAPYSLTVTTRSATWQIDGVCDFYFVRGDSAAIPPDAVVFPDVPDSSRWWLDRWEELPAASANRSGAANRTMPAVAPRWGDLKQLYR